MARRGLRFDDITTVDTPAAQRPPHDFSTIKAELTVTGIMELLGTPAYASRFDNDSCLFHDVVAHAGNANTVSSQGAARLAPHNDNAAEVSCTWLHVACLNVAWSARCCQACSCIPCRHDVLLDAVCSCPGRPHIDARRAVPWRAALLQPEPPCCLLKTWRCTKCLLSGTP